MSKAERSSNASADPLASDEWQVLQSFLEGSGRPQYECKSDESGSRLSIEDDLVVIRRTSALDGQVTEFSVPESVLERVVETL